MKQALFHASIWMLCTAMAAAILFLGSLSHGDSHAEAQGEPVTVLYCGFNFITGEHGDPAAYVAVHTDITAVWHWYAAEQRWLHHFPDVPPYLNAVENGGIKTMLYWEIYAIHKAC